MLTRTFKSGNSVAVRLLGETAFPPNTEVEVTRTGSVVTVYPARRKSMKEMVEELRKLPKPAQIEKREPIDMPDREPD